MNITIIMFLVFTVFYLSIGLFFVWILHHLLDNQLTQFNVVDETDHIRKLSKRYIWIILFLWLPLSFYWLVEMNVNDEN